MSTPQGPQAPQGAPQQPAEQPAWGQQPPGGWGAPQEAAQDRPGEETRAVPQQAWNGTETAEVPRQEAPPPEPAPADAGEPEERADPPQREQEHGGSDQPTVAVAPHGPQQAPGVEETRVVPLPGETADEPGERGDPSPPQEQGQPYASPQPHYETQPQAAQAPQGPQHPGQHQGPPQHWQGAPQAQPGQPPHPPQQGQPPYAQQGGPYGQPQPGYAPQGAQPGQPPQGQQPPPVFGQPQHGQADATQLFGPPGQPPQPPQAQSESTQLFGPPPHGQQAQPPQAPQESTQVFGQPPHGHQESTQVFGQPQAQQAPPQQGQQPYGQQGPGYGPPPYGQQPGWQQGQQAPWGQQPGQQWGGRPDAHPQQWGAGYPPPQPPGEGGAKGRTPLYIGIAAAVVVLALVGVLGFVTPGFFTTQVLDATAVQQGVQQVLSQDYGLAVEGVTCAEGVEVQAGATFECQATVDGENVRVPITITSDDGNYQVGRPV